MRMQDYLIALIVGSLFITLPLGYMYFAYPEMGVTMDTEANETFGEFGVIASEANSHMTNMTAEMQAKSPGGSEVNANTDQTYEDNLVKASTRVISLIPQSYKIFSKALQTLGNRVGIHPLFISAAFMIVIIILAFLFISALLRQTV